MQIKVFKKYIEPQNIRRCFSELFQGHRMII